MKDCFTNWQNLSNSKILTQLFCFRTLYHYLFQEETVYLLGIKRKDAFSTIYVPVTRGQSTSTYYYADAQMRI